MRKIIVAAALALIPGVALAQTYRDTGNSILVGVVPVAPNVGPLFVSGNSGVVNVDAASNVAMETGGNLASLATNQLAVQNTTGSAAPGSAVYTGMTVGGNLTGLKGTTSGLQVDEVSGSLFHTDFAGLLTQLDLLSTAANQSTEIASLSTIATNTGSAIPTGGNNVGFMTPAPSGAVVGATLYHHYSAATAGGDAQFIKASPGTLYSLTGIQTTTTPMEIKLYNLTAAPTCSSTAGVLANYPIQSNVIAPGFSIPIPAVGWNFSTGIAYCIVAQGSPVPADADNGAAATGVVLNAAYN